MKKGQPPIGVPRVYHGEVCPLIYPGEVARPQFDQSAILDAMALAAQYGSAAVQVPVTGWLVEPAPGWQARWLRLRFRMVGHWFGGRPKLSASVELVDRDPSERTR